MLITNKEQLKNFSSAHRFWQGIPGLEVTKKGRIFSTFYSGGYKEGVNNFVVLLKSDDDGKTFSEPIAVAYVKDKRCYDEMIWIDPLGRLWWTWSYADVQGKEGVYGTICQDPDADELCWGEVFFIGKYVLMNKPIVLSTGDWLFPIAIWRKDLKIPGVWANTAKDITGAYAYKCVDKNQTFLRLGGATVPERGFDEHMIFEKKNGQLAMFVRTAYGIGVSYSFDQGHTWSEGQDSKLKGPSSRFFIRRLKSGRVLLVNHYNFEGRNNLTALLSEDDGETWKYSLLLDERSDISYPDGVETENGYIYITYDRERGDFYGNSLEELNKKPKSAREILFAKFTEEDIIAGKIVDKNSKLKQVISKVEGKIQEKNPFGEIERFSDAELAQTLCKSDPSEIVKKIFEYYPVSCINMREVDNEKLDSLIEKLQEEKENKMQTALEMIRLVRSVSQKDAQVAPVVEAVKNILCENLSEEISTSQIAKKVRVSEYYLMHLFKKQTGISIGEYKKALKMASAKLLLIESDKKVEEIAFECGFFDANYFSRAFKQAEKLSPLQYRKLHKK